MSDLLGRKAGNLRPHRSGEISPECIADMFARLQRNDLNVNVMFMHPRTYADLLNTAGKHLPCDEWNSGYDSSARY